jgi:dihydrodipicolinate synthase/N-acetylneuraminate lyase
MPALITPFTRSGSIDIDAHRRNVVALAQRGVRGFLVGGSTGEGPFLESGERERLTAAARETAPGAFLLAGITAPSLRMALGQIGEAHAAGADAVLVLSPTALLGGRHDLVEGFFADVADAAPLPTFLYSHPKGTGYEIPLEVIAALAAHHNVAGMKDSGGDPIRAAAILTQAPPQFLLYAGSSPAIALSRAAGAHGAIAASANHLPELVREVVERAGRSPRAAAAAQAALTTASTAVERFGIAGTKAAARLAGLEPGTLRRPLRPLTRSQARAVEAAWSAAVAVRAPTGD